MNILNKLSLKSLKLNKKRTIGTIIGIILSTSLICAVAGMFTSFKKTLVQNAINETGYYHLEIHDINETDLTKLNSNRMISNIKTMFDLGYSTFEHENESNPYIHVYSTDYLEELSFTLTEGKMPESSNEILINKKTMMDGNFKIGDTITLNLGTRKTIDGFDLDDSNPFHGDLENLVNTKEKTYKIVGTFKKAGYNYNYTGITTKETSGTTFAYIALKNPKTYEKSLPMILDQKDYDETLYRDLSKTKYNYDVNTELLRWEAFAFSDSTVSMLTTVISVVIIIIIISSVFCIRNSFAISITEKTKMYGMLSSIGATKKQIKRSVIYEGFILGLIGVPLGILAGIFAVFVLIKIVNLILDGILFESLDEILFNISLSGVLLSLLLGFITIYISSLKSAINASKVTPIENLTNSERIKINSKKLKVPKIIEKLFGIGGTLAYKNLKRSKKKYRTTVISLTISIFVFISMNSFLKEAFDLSNKYYTEYDYNLVVTGIKNLKDKDIEYIRNMNGVNTLHVLYEANNYIKITDKNKLDNLEDIPYDKECKNESDEECNDIYRSIEIIALDDLSYKDYIKKLNLNYNELKTKGILVDEYKYYIGSKEKISRSYKFEKGDIIKGNINSIDLEIEIGQIEKIRPYGYENRYYGGGYLVLNEKYFKNLNFTPYYMTIDSSKTDEIVKNLESMSTDYDITNYEETKKQDQGMRLIISIFLYGFITVITLIGVTSIFNTITSNMELRSKEFAMLKSIGMTKKEFKHLINLETLFYSTKSLLYGIILGLFGSYTLHLGFNKKEETIFEIPYLAILLSIIFVFLLVYIIMKFSISKINKQNTIETIRNDNI